MLPIPLPSHAEDAIAASGRKPRIDDGRAGHQMFFTCARCEVSAGRIDGEPARLPDTWSRTGGDTYCLSCSRARAGEAAVVSVPESISRQDRAKLQRSALIAFEIARTPAAPNRAIANACRTSALAVAAVRDTLTDHATHSA